MKRVVPVMMVVLILVVVAAGWFTAAAYAKKPGGGGDDGCPRNIFCPTYWDPVICDDGKIYSNECFAYAACATGCESLGQGPIPLIK